MQHRHETVRSTRGSFDFRHTYIFIFEVALAAIAIGVLIDVRNGVLMRRRGEHDWLPETANDERASRSLRASIGT